MAGAMTRRSALGTLGAVGAALATGTLSIGAPARAQAQGQSQALGLQESVQDGLKRVFGGRAMKDGAALIKLDIPRSEEHTSELQSPCNLECRLLLEKKTN